MFRQFSPIFNRIPLVLCVILISGLILSTPTQTKADEAITSDQKETIEQIIRNYLLENPEVILEAMQVLRAREERAEKDNNAKTLKLVEDAIYNDPLSPHIGSQDASVTIVEFFDYRCGYCKRVFPALQEILESDKDIHMVFKEFPILGEDSILASRAAMAIWLNWPDKYMKFHTNLITSRGSITESKILEYASAQSINPDELKAHMKAKQIDEALLKTASLAKQLGINGTPGFIIGKELIPGAIDIAAMKQLIEQARSGS